MAAQIIEFFRKLFDTSSWPPRWHCGEWSSFHGWLYILSDLLVWSAYFAIPIIILVYVRRKNLAFQRIYFLFAAFILACGLTHLIDAIIFWWPIYRVSALARFGTGIVSWVTVYHLIRLLPQAFSLKTPEELQLEIDQRKQAQQLLLEKNNLLNRAQHIGKIGHCERNLDDNGLIYGSPEFFLIFGLPANQTVIHLDEFLKQVHPEDQAYVREVSNSMEEQPTPLYFRVMRPDGTMVSVFSKSDKVINKAGKIEKVVTIVQDITQTKQMEESLRLKTRELEQRVEDMQRFAFLASHDLKEPMRKMSMFASLLKGQHSEHFTDKGKEYIDKILDGAVRHQQMIEDMLSFARVSEEEHSFELYSLTDAANEALSDLQVLQLESNATVQIDPMPEIEMAAVQIRLLFQNLLANAMKFRRQDIPCKVHVWSEMTNFEGLGLEKEVLDSYSVLGDPAYWQHQQFCKVHVEDNGIGFEKEYEALVFKIFKRLHAKQGFDGTGMGLAISRKIVENHHGNIWAIGAPEAGAHFIFVLPVSQKRFRSV